ncbi:unnamed protein product [Angiostrongylus costaricensis]|uniref:Alpha-galactosidase n=1 Tax=Angiostrongylus costaricensis TaxID=334426 RepID=A0A158PMD2_ANGCS|nr:unnamed protein product [Angiostrongylus costaricensis]
MLLFLAVSLQTVSALDNGLARTPPMGWMSWTAFYCEMDCVKHPKSCINENLYMEIADALVRGGYREAGYVNVHVDDCWMERERDKDSGRLLPDRYRFPNGMHALSRYMHARGLKFGIYGDYGTKTCAGFPGSLGHLKVDAETFAQWEVDYLKLDGCNVDTALMRQGYPSMERELNLTGRPIVYSCSWPAYLIDKPEQNRHIPTHGPGHWHDPDMLVIGNSGITVNMAIAQMTIWSIWSAPLIMSNDLRTIAPEFQKILLNRDVIAIDQDPIGKMGRLVANISGVSAYVKPITPVYDGEFSFALGFLNRNNKKNDVQFTLKNLGLTNPRGYEVKDLWMPAPTLKLYPTDTIEIIVPGTGASMFRAELVKPNRWIANNRISEVFTNRVLMDF